MIAGYLARATFDQHKRIAVVFTTCGRAGSNSVGYEQAASLCAVRKIEARRALAFLNVVNVWFAGGRDTPGSDPLVSLETWGHGKVLERVVRYVRLTRPDVIITWLPDFADGENHADHQAAGVIATEAFDMAGDPTVFSEQVAMPYDHSLIGNRTEGLRPWQPKKLYFFTHAIHNAFVKGQGPEYSVTEVSPSRHVAYYELAAQELSYHLSQVRDGWAGRKAVYERILKHYHRISPQHFVLGKSLVSAPITGDIFAGITAGPIPFHPVTGYRPQLHKGVSVELGLPWNFYRRFWHAHDLKLAKLYPPEAVVPAGSTFTLPIIIHNTTAHSQRVSLTTTIPPRWKQTSGAELFPVDAHNFYPARADFEAPTGERPTWQDIVVKAEVDGQTVSSATLRVIYTPSRRRNTVPSK